MGNILGIDLGASYLKAVYLKEGETILRPVLNSDGNCVFRVCGVRGEDGRLKLLTEDGQRMEAHERGVPLIENVKPLRGHDPVAVELEAAVLRVMLEQYRKASGNHDLAQLDKVVLTHPVSTGPAALSSLKQVAISAGLSPDRIETIEEPTAGGLFGVRQFERFDGRVLVIDAGHYTTDFVVVEFARGRPVLRSSHHLGVRLGVGEFAHAVARSLWLKAQILAHRPRAAESPFDVAGPGFDDPLVTQLCGLTEERVLIARQEWFAAGNPASFYPANWQAGHGRTWLESAELAALDYYFHLEDARTEVLNDLGKEHESRIRQLNYRAAIRPLLHALQAATISVLFDLDDRANLRVALGGGLSLLPEVRDAVTQVLARHGVPAPESHACQYPGLGNIHMGELLWVASGAALAGQKGLTREDTLSDTIGIIASYPAEEALCLMAEAGCLPPDDVPLAGAHQVPGEAGFRLFLHRVVARRGASLPCTIHFPEYLQMLGTGARIPVTRFGDLVPTATTMPVDAGEAPGVVAWIDIPYQNDGPDQFRLILDVKRNDDWSLRVLDLEGREVISRHVSLLLGGGSRDSRS